REIDDERAFDWRAVEDAPEPVGGPGVERARDGDGVAVGEERERRLERTRRADGVKRGEVCLALVAERAAVEPADPGHVRLGLEAICHLLPCEPAAEFL